MLGALLMTGCGGQIDAVPLAGPSSTVSSSTDREPELPAPGRTPHEVADQLCAWGCAAGLAGVVIEERAGSLTVWWKGPLPDYVRRYLATVPDSVSVTVYETARWDRAEMSAAASRVMSDSALVARLGITMAGNIPDGSGIKVGIKGTGLGPGDLAELERVSAMPVTIETGRTVTPQ